MVSTTCVLVASLAGVFASTPSSNPPKTRRPVTCDACTTPGRQCSLGEPYWTCVDRPRQLCNTPGVAVWCEITPTLSSLPKTTLPPRPRTPAPLTCGSCQGCKLGEPFWSCKDIPQDQCTKSWMKWCGN